MNTVCIVKNCALQFMEAPEEVKLDWVYKMLDTDKMKSFQLIRDLHVLHVNDRGNVTYRVKFGEYVKDIQGDFILAKRENNSYFPLSEQLEDFIIDNLKITRL